MSATYPLNGAICDGVATADYDPFFPTTPEDELDALAMCRICPARGPCLVYAVETGQMFGIWAADATPAPPADPRSRRPASASRPT